MGVDDVMCRLLDLGVDMYYVGMTLERRGVDGFRRTFERVMKVLRVRRQGLGGG